MNKEQNMGTYYTDDIWNELELDGKCRDNVFNYIRSTSDDSVIYDFIKQLHTEAKYYGVLLSVKVNEYSGALYVYLRKNHG